jgi:hypothetical protein
LPLEKSRKQRLLVIASKSEQDQFSSCLHQFKIPSHSSLFLSVMPEKETSPQLSVLEIVAMLTAEPEALGLTSPARMRRDFLPSSATLRKRALVRAHGITERRILVPLSNILLDLTDHVRNELFPPETLHFLRYHPDLSGLNCFRPRQAEPGDR